MESKSEKQPCPALSFWQADSNYQRIMQDDLHGVAVAVNNKVLDYAKKTIANPQLTFKQKRVAIAFIHRWEKPFVFPNLLFQALLRPTSQNTLRAMDILNLYHPLLSLAQKWELLEKLIVLKDNSPLMNKLINAVYATKARELCKLLLEQGSICQLTAIKSYNLNTLFAAHVFSLLEEMAPQLSEVELDFTPVLAHLSDENVQRLLHITAHMKLCTNGTFQPIQQKNLVKEPVLQPSLDMIEAQLMQPDDLDDCQLLSLFTSLNHNIGSLQEWHIEKALSLITQLIEAEEAELIPTDVLSSMLELISTIGYSAFNRDTLKTFVDRLEQTWVNNEIHTTLHLLTHDPLCNIYSKDEQLGTIICNQF